MNFHPYCDGSGPHSADRVARVLPTGGDSNAILCLRCFAKELAWRQERNGDLAPECRFELPTWDALKVYEPCLVDAVSDRLSAEFRACGLNADWSFSAWCLSGKVNQGRGFYLLDDEEGAFLLVHRDFDTDEIAEVATIQPEALAAMFPGLEVEP